MGTQAKKRGIAAMAGIRTIYLIKRGERPSYHKAPFHPVILCTLKRIAQWEAGSSSDHAWVWTNGLPGKPGVGWLLERWNGFDIDYGAVVHGFNLPDGTPAAFWRDYTPRNENAGCVKDLFPGAVWWSDKIMPEWLQKRGVIYPPDKFTQWHILDHIADDGMMGVGRDIPSHWKKQSAEAADK
jgi:hypothetical protein